MSLCVPEIKSLLPKCSVPLSPQVNICFLLVLLFMNKYEFPGEERGIGGTLVTYEEERVVYKTSGSP